MRAAVLADMQEINQRLQAPKKQRPDDDSNEADHKTGHRLCLIHVLVPLEIKGFGGPANQKKSHHAANNAQKPMARVSKVSLKQSLL